MRLDLTEARVQVSCSPERKWREVGWQGEWERGGLMDLRTLLLSEEKQNWKKRPKHSYTKRD